MTIVDKVLGGLRDKEQRDALHHENANRRDDGPAALALGKPAEYVVDDKIGGTHTREVKDAVVHENVLQHAHHEVTPIVNRERTEVEVFQKVQPVVDNQEIHTHHQHVAPQVSRHVQEEIDDDTATRYRSQGQFQHQQTVGDQTHSTSVNAPIVREHVNKHIIEEVQPIIQRQTQRVEHHHTTQQINETHVKAPVIHSVVHNAPITMAEFTGKVADLGTGHLGHSHTGSTGSIGSSSGAAGGLGSRGVGSGLTGHNEGSGLHSGTAGLAGAGTGAGLAGAGTGAGLAGSNNDRTDGGLNEVGRSGHGLKLGHMEETNRPGGFDKDHPSNTHNHAYTTPENAGHVSGGGNVDKKPSLLDKITGHTSNNTKH